MPAPVIRPATGTPEAQFTVANHAKGSPKFTFIEVIFCSRAVLERKVSLKQKEVKRIFLHEELTSAGSKDQKMLDCCSLPEIYTQC